MNRDGTGEVRLSNKGGTGPAWSPDGTRIALESGSDLYLVNADGSEIQRLTTGGGGVRDPAWSPDGRWIVFSSTPANGNLWADTDLWVRVNQFGG